MIRALSIAILAIAFFVAFGPYPAPTKRILFVGNSFTFGGNIPYQVQQIAASSRPSARYEVEMAVRPGATLEELLTETDAAERLRGADWDVVVLQDASVMAFRPEWVLRMTAAAGAFAKLAQAQDADLLYFAHWAPDTQSADRPGAIRTIEDTYKGIARATGGEVAPAGRMWLLAEAAGVDGLYASDAHHASVKGAYAAALAITDALKDVDASSSNWAPEGVSPEDQQKLREAARLLSKTPADLSLVSQF